MKKRYISLKWYKITRYQQKIMHYRDRAMRKKKTNVKTLLRRVKKR
jgi:hypothetical protein